MNKRLLCTLLSTLMLLGCLLLPVCAVVEEDVVPVFSCDTMLGSMVLDTTKKTEGHYSLRLTMKDGGFSFANTAGSLNVDISRADTVAMDIYLSDPKKIVPAIKEMTLELTSSGKIDSAEIAFYIAQVLKGQLAELKSGWNTVYLYFEDAGRTNNPDPVDLTKINFTRFFGTFIEQPGLAGELFLIDNIRACYTGGPSFDDLENLEQYRGDNSGVEIEVDGVVRPDIDNRHNEITIVQGDKISEEDRVPVVNPSLVMPSVSVNPDEQPQSSVKPPKPSTSDEPSKPSDEQPSDEQPSDEQPSDEQPGTDIPEPGVTTADTTLILVVVACAAVVVIAASLLALVLVLSKVKKK